MPEQQQVVKIDTKITKAFKIDILKVQHMVRKYQELTLIPEDESSYKICRTALTSCIRTRTGIEKRRLALNAEDQKKIKGRKTAADQLTAIIEPAETHLTDLVKGEAGRKEAIEEEEKRREHEKISARVMALGKYRVILPVIDVSTMTDTEFDTALAEAKTDWDAEEKRQADAEALRKSEEERLEKQRQAQEAEAARLAGIQAAQEADQAARDKKQKEETDKLEAEKKELAAQKWNLRLQILTNIGFKQDGELLEHPVVPSQTHESHLIALPDDHFSSYVENVISDIATQEEVDKIAAEAKEKADKKAAEEARIQVIEDAIINEKAEAEEAARLKTLKPIKDRICDYADDILKETPPKFEDKDAQDLMNWAWEELALLSDTIKEKAEAL